jgi:hypothetical protein
MSEYQKASSRGRQPCWSGHTSSEYQKARKRELEIEHEKALLHWAPVRENFAPWARGLGWHTEVARARGLGARGLGSRTRTREREVEIESFAAAGSEPSGRF